MTESIVTRDISIMTRLEPGEILESPVGKITELENKIESLQSEIAQANKEIRELRIRNRMEYSANDIFSRALSNEEYPFHLFTGRCTGGSAMMFHESRLEDVIFRVDDDDVVILRNCNIGKIHFEGIPGAIFVESIEFGQNARVTWSEGVIEERKFFDLHGNHEHLYSLFANKKTDEEE